MRDTGGKFETLDYEIERAADEFLRKEDPSEEDYRDLYEALRKEASRLTAA